MKNFKILNYFVKNDKICQKKNIKFVLSPSWVRPLSDYISTQEILNLNSEILV
jgi:hypothetical protein